MDLHRISGSDKYVRSCKEYCYVWIEMKTKLNFCFYFSFSQFVQIIKRTITCWLDDMNFIFSCWKPLENRIHIFALPCNNLGTTWYRFYIYIYVKTYVYFQFPFSSSYFFQIPFRNSRIPFPFLIFNIFFPFPVTKSQSQCGLNLIFPGQNLPIPIPILPLQDPLLSTPMFL